MLDTQSERIANEWNVVVVTINYTKGIEIERNQIEITV